MSQHTTTRQLGGYWLAYLLQHLHRKLRSNRTACDELVKRVRKGHSNSSQVIACLAVNLGCRILQECYSRGAAVELIVC